MKRIIRIIGFALVLLLLFFAAVVFMAGWLKRQNDQLLADALKTRSVQFAEILELTQAGPPPWSDDFTQRLAQALDAEIAIHTTPPIAPPPATILSTRWHFDHVFRNSEGAPIGYAQVVLATPPTVRVMLMLQRLSALLLFLALLLVLAVVLLVIFDRRWLRDDDDDTSAFTANLGDSATGYGMLSHLAERSARQTVELEREREDRQRAEADAHLKQILLNRALQEKIDMGRDLHDGLIQSLYATGLTIQAGRKALDADPAGARTQIDTALQTLNAAIREVRTYISGLGPEQLRQRSFADSVRAIVEHLSSGRELATDLRIDEEAAHQLTTGQSTDLLQIVREAVSNSLRHGHAKQLAIRLHRNGNELCLSIQDTGHGFDPQLAVRGHGLDNMQARADRLAAQLRCLSEPGQGTRLVLTFNAPASTI